MDMKYSGQMCSFSFPCSIYEIICNGLLLEKLQLLYCTDLYRLVINVGPLWQWSGRSFQHKRKGKGKKSFYKAIVRGDETICVSDSAFPVPELVSRAIISFPVLRLLSSLMIGS